MCGCATSNSQVHRVLRIDRPCGRITCRRTQSIQNIRMHIACFEFTAPLDEFHAAVCSYMPRTHGQKQNEFSCTSHALHSSSVWTNHMRSRATNSTKTCIRIVCFEFTASRDELHAGVCSCMSHMLGQKNEFACNLHASNSPSVWTNYMQMSTPACWACVIKNELSCGTHAFRTSINMSRLKQ